MPLNILFASPAYKPAWRYGGPVHSVAALAEHLAARGHDVSVVTTNSNADRDLDVPTGQPVHLSGVEVVYCAREEPLRRLVPFIPYLARSTGFLYSRQLRPELERRIARADVVHTHLPFVYPTWAGAQVAFRAGVPLFYHQRGVFDPGRLRFRGLKKHVYIRLVERPILRRATTLVALTEVERTSYRALGVATPCTVIPNGIEVAQFRSARAPEDGARWGIPPHASVILFLGRLHPIKGADRLLEAFLGTAAAHPNAWLVLAGPDEFGLEARYRDAASRAGLAGRIVFPGMVQGEPKRELLARADVFCLPSDAEGFSIAVLEALASSTAVIISPGCNFPEAVAAGAGWIAPLQVPALADVLSNALADPTALVEMGRRGRALVERGYRWDGIAGRMEEAYMEGIARVRGAQRQGT